MQCFSLGTSKCILYRVKNSQLGIKRNWSYYFSGLQAEYWPALWCGHLPFRLNEWNYCFQIRGRNSFVLFCTTVQDWIWHGQKCFGGDLGITAATDSIPLALHCFLVPNISHMGLGKFVFEKRVIKEVATGGDHILLLCHHLCNVSWIDTIFTPAEVI